MTSPAVANLASVRARRAKADVRNDIRTGVLPLCQVLEHPPVELHRDLLTDVLLLAPLVGKGRIEKLGRAAADSPNAINLLVPLGTASAATRAWVVERLTAGGTPQPAELPTVVEESVEVVLGDVDLAEHLISMVRRHRRMVRSIVLHPNEFGRADGLLWDAVEELAAVFDIADTEVSLDTAEAAAA